MSTIVALHLAQTSAARVERVVLTTPPPPKGFGYDAATHARLQEVARGDDTQRARALAFMLGDRLGPEWLRFKLARWRETSDPDAVAADVTLAAADGLGAAVGASFPRQAAIGRRRKKAAWARTERCMDRNTSSQKRRPSSPASWGRKGPEHRHRRARDCAPAERSQCPI